MDAATAHALDSFFFAQLAFDDGHAELVARLEVEGERLMRLAADPDRRLDLVAGFSNLVRTLAKWVAEASPGKTSTRTAMIRHDSSHAPKRSSPGRLK